MRDLVLKKTALLVVYTSLICVYILEAMTRSSHGALACVTPVTVIILAALGWLCVACDKWRWERMVCAGLGFLLGVDAFLMVVDAFTISDLKLGFDRLALAGFFFYRLSRLNQSLDGGR